MVSSVSSTVSVTCTKTTAYCRAQAGCLHSYKWTATMGEVTGEVTVCNGILELASSKLCLLAPNAISTVFQPTTQQSWDMTTDLKVVGSATNSSAWSSNAEALHIQVRALNGEFTTTTATTTTATTTTQAATTTTTVTTVTTTTTTTTTTATTTTATTTTNTDTRYDNDGWLDMTGLTSSMSSTHSSLVAGKANDGSFSTNFQKCALSVSGGVVPAWWSVDLGYSYTISHVEITNSGHVNHYLYMNDQEGAGFDIHVTSRDFWLDLVLSLGSATTSTKCSGPNSLNKGATSQFACDGTGGKVWIVGGQPQVAICEVRVRVQTV